MKLAIYIFSAFLLGICHPLFSQGYQNLDTYKNLRKRLQKDFTLIGDGQGKSLVAERRSGTDYPGKLIFHADETSNMGYYLATLATEYQLLKINGKSTFNTLEELTFAVKAINRLDETAESYIRTPATPPSPQTGDLNGFFIRSDVSHSFFSDNAGHFNSGEYGSSPVDGITSSLYNETLQYIQPLRESQDQVLNLLMGLSFVTKYVHDSIPGFIFQDGISDLSREAKAISHRMITYLKSNGWKVKDPVTGTFLNNAQGGEAVHLSYAFAEAACAISNEFSGVVSGFPEKRCNTYHDGVTASNYYFFQFMKNYVECPQGYSTSSTSCRACHELYKPMMLAAIGSSYYQNGTDVTANILSQQGVNTEIQIIPLIHQILWNKGSLVNDSVYTTLLNHPLPNGPYNAGSCDYPHFEWSAPVRWRQPERRGAGCMSAEQDTACFNFFSGEYNGLDYMLLFNLYCLKEPGYVNYDLGEPLGINESLNNVSVLVTQNDITVTSEIIVTSIELYDLKGAKIYISVSSDKRQSIPVRELTRGIYLLRVRSGTETITKKVALF